MRKLVCLLMLSALLGLTCAHAQENSSKASVEKGKTPAVRLGTVNVTAKRYETQELDTPAFTTVIDRADMERNGAEDVFELLRTQGGMSFSAQLPGGMSQGGMNGEMGIRGIKGGELIMINGLSINEPTSDAYDLDTIPTAFLERVEIVKGAASTLYGSRAMTGVVNMRTRRPGEKAAGGSVMYGTHNRVDGNAWFRNKYVFAGVSYAGFDGIDGVKQNYSRSSPYGTDLTDTKKYSALVSVRPWSPLTFNYMYTRADTGYKRTYFKKPASDYDMDQKLDHHYFSADYENAGWILKAYARLNLLKNDYDYKVAAKPSRTTDKKNWTYGLDGQKSFAYSSYMFLVGGNYAYETMDDTREDLAGSSKKGYYIKSTVLDYDRHQFSLFGNVERTFADQLTLTVGLRGQAVKNTEDGSDDYLEPVPQFQGLYRITKNNSAFVNIGRAFRVPTFNQLYSKTSRFEGNPELKPEFGWTYEAGWKAEYDIWSLTLSGFVMDYKDKIRYLYNEEKDTRVAENVDKFRTLGFEWNAALKLHEFVTFKFAGYVGDPWEVEDGEKTQAGPKAQFAPGVYFDNGKLTLNLFADFITQRERNLDDYTNLHATASYKITEYLKLKLRADNLLDSKLVAYGDMTPGISSPYEIFEDGIWIFGGLEIDLSLL